MTVAILTEGQAISRIAMSLQMRGTSPSIRSTVAQALRRASYVLAPCPRHDLESGVASSFVGLGGGEKIDELVESTLDSLLVYGDILEMRPKPGDEWEQSPLVLRPAPPSFVIRGDGSAVILGVAGDDLLGFTGEMAEKVSFDTVLRLLPRQHDIELREYLKENGLVELSEKAWLRTPSEEQARSYVAMWTERLRAQRLGNSDNALILEGRRSPAFYKGRWAAPTNQSGMYVGRRPQRFGADLWCLYEIERGEVIRFLDLFSIGDRLRPCDIAWRVQMAIDSLAENPQKIRSERSGPHVFLDFFSPLPSWAERHLCVDGEETRRAGALITYVIPASRFELEVDFLKRFLWLEHEAR